MNSECVVEERKTILMSIVNFPGGKTMKRKKCSSRIPERAIMIQKHKNSAFAVYARNKTFNEFKCNRASSFMYKFYISTSLPTTASTS